jgi:hypothetical protein
MARVFRSAGERYAAGAVRALLKGLTTHGNPDGQACYDAVMAGLSEEEKAAVNYAVVGIEYEIATRPAARAGGQDGEDQ